MMLKVTFLSFVIPIAHEIQHVLTTMCLHINWKVHTACNLNFVVNGEGLLKVTDSHVHWKSGNMLEMVQETYL